MLYTRNAFYFRKFYKEKVAKEKYPIDLNFVGSTAPGNHNDGFSKLIYGNREDLGKLLGTIALNVAADDQAIYELIQNADDCKSSFFSVNYNEKYLLCINNGNYFSDLDMSAIINVAGNYKDGEDIGTFGIGFKILHRLVGADDGREAIINDYAGPIIFSWNNYFQLKKFIEGEPIFVSGIGKAKENYDYERDRENPWLIKLLYTCFPTNYKEPIKLGDYNTKGAKFDESELTEMREFLGNSLQNVNLAEDNYLKSGSIFFLRLGKGKSKFLDEGIDKIKSGLSYSFKFLNSLQKIYINGEEIKAQAVLDYSHSFPIDSKEFKEINPKNKNRDIKFTFAYYRDYKKAGDLQKKLAPNLYTFFSMDEEKNGFSFLLHCNAFDMNNDRRKLQANSQINDKLLPIIAQTIIEYSDSQKENNRNLFLSLYANFLLSKEPKNKPHIDNNFSKYIHQYITETIPTKNGFSSNAQNVKINKTKLELNLSDFGLGHIEWFEWDKEEDNLLISEAKNKLEIEEWSLRDVFVNADLDCLNDWIKSLPQKYYINFLKELDREYFSKEAVERLLETELFKFSDGGFYSITEVVKNDDLVFLSNKVINIQTELKSLDFLISDLDISSFSFYDKVSSKLKPDEDLYDTISERTSTENNLAVNQKQNLFRNFINPETKFDGIGDETLKKLELFCDSQGEIKPLFQLVSSSLKKHPWLNPYKIKADENFDKLSNYLIQEEDLFDKIILPNIEIIKDKLTEANEIKELLSFFKDNHRSFFNEYIIQKQTNCYEIIDKSDSFQVVPPNKGTKEFIENYLSDELIILPYDFSDFNNENGIIKGEDLHNLILDFVEADEHQETLVDIIHYDEPKRKFLQEISEFRFHSDTEYTKEDYEYKILEMACGKLKENNYQEFKDKVIIETEEQELTLSEIPPFTDKIKINDYELSLAKILPDNYENSDHLSSLINQFIGLGLNKEQIENLFGISEEPEPSNIFQIFSEQVKILENAEQLAFLLLYNECEEEIDLTAFSVLAKDGEEYNLTYNYYTKSYDFISDDVILDDKYKGIKKILKELPFAITDKNQLLEEPYFDDEKFICPDLIKENLSDEQKLSLIDFLYNQWDKKNKKTAIRNIDWSKINDTETENILGFNPMDSVFPNKFAISEEQLPEYILKWIGKDGEKVKFISDIKINTEDSFIISLRKFLKNGGEFQLSRIAREGNESQLFNTFKWLKENELKLKSDDALSVFKEMVAVINIKRNEAKAEELVLEDEFDFETLGKESNELNEDYYLKWKENLEDKFSIFLFNGELPKTIQLDEVDDYIFRKYFSNDIAISDDNSIYINAQKISELKKLLSGLVSDGKLSSDELLQLYQSGDDTTSQNGISISKEDMELLTTIKKIGNADEILQLAKQLGGRNLAQIIEVGSQAFRNDGATFNTGNEGEKIVFADLKRKFPEPNRVRWTSAENPEVDQPTNEYDFEIYDKSLKNVLYFVDSKSTTTRKYQTDKTEIYWRNSEWKFIEEQADSNYIIARVFNVNSNNPEIIYLKISREEL